MEKELERLRAKLQEDPDSLLFAQYADLLRKAGRIEEAIDVLNRGIMKHPNYSMAYLVLGRCYRDQGAMDTAIRNFEQAFSLDRQSLPALKELADAYIKTGNVKKAREALEHILAIDPLDEETRRKLESLPKEEEEKEPEKTETPGVPETDFFAFFEEVIEEKKQETAAKAPPPPEAKPEVTPEPAPVVQEPTPPAPEPAPPVPDYFTVELADIYRKHGFVD
ncbi:hypothetical protein DRQ18_03835, partial [bacterium]